MVLNYSHVIVMKKCEDSGCLKHKEHWHLKSEQVTRRDLNKNRDFRIGYGTAKTSFVAEPHSSDSI